MKEVVLVPEWKLPVIECRACSMRFLLMGYIEHAKEEWGEEEFQAIPQCEARFCPYCGAWQGH